MKKFASLLAALLLITILSAQPTPKVLILGIDGCRQDALIAATTPNIDALIANATYSYDAFTEPATWSGVGWSGMLTGVWKEKHGVQDNSFTGSNFGQYPHVFNAIEACDPNNVTASIVHWGPINSEILDLADYELIVGTDLEVRTEAVDYLTNNDPDILFLHFDDVDLAGHNNGFLPDVPAYLQVIEDTDAHIGHVLTAITDRPNYPDEDWLIMVSTDHGGTLSGHGGSSFEEINIFVIASGNSILNQEIAKTELEKTFTETLVFNGLDHYIDLPDQPEYDFGTDQDFTIECMIKVNNIDGDASIIGNKDWASGANKGFVFSFVYANGPECKVNIGDGTNRLDITGFAVDDGKWHHIAASFDRDGLMTMYQNGVLVQAVDMTSIGDVNTPYPIAIGQDGTHNYGSWFDGEIAEVKIWSAALDENTIIQNACLPADANHPFYNDLIGYWPIDEGSGTLINDLSSLQNNGTLIGAAENWSSNSGKIICLDYTTTPRIVDVAVTALDYLCGTVDPALDLDGTSLLDIALPVELIQFTGYARDQFNYINWKVGTQENVKQYELERSKSGKNDFITVGIQSADLSSTNYSLTDKDPLDQAYYRLKVVDHDGAINYSPLLFIERENNHFAIIGIKPNPVRSEFKIMVSSPENGEKPCRTNIVDIYGRLVKSQDNILVKGQNEIIIETEKMTSGLYYIILKNGENRLVRKFVKE